MQLPLKEVKVYMILLLLCLYCVYPTSAHFCISEQLHQEKLQSDSNYRNAYHAMNQEIAKASVALWKERKEHGMEKAATAEEIYTIPVVVHLVHNSQQRELGDGANIRENQVHEGIKQLNDAFESLNFYESERGVDIGIEFCLAVQTPDGLPTTGIVRHENNTFAELDIATEEIEFKKRIAAWDPSQYMNIWVVDEICKSDLESNPCKVAAYSYLATEHGQKHDGVVTEEVYFGGDAHKAKVVIHEVGHYFNLQHTFNGGCPNGNCLLNGDYICDTPPDDDTRFLPCDDPVNSCNTDSEDTSENNPFRSKFKGGLGDVDDLIENYMDYSRRSCQTSFTAGQRDRMRISLDVRRSSLLNGKGCESLNFVDVVLQSIEEPFLFACQDSLEAVITIKNEGTQALNKLDILYQTELGNLYEHQWQGTLRIGEEISIFLPAILLEKTADYNLIVSLANPNGTNDHTPANNVKSHHFQFLKSNQLPFVEGFDNNQFAKEWWTLNPDKGVAWELKATQNNCSATGTGYLVMNHHKAENVEGQSDWIYTNIDLTNYQEALLNFDVAYVPRNENTPDALRVHVYGDCGYQSNILYNKIGRNLSTIDFGIYENEVWTPSNCDEWRTEQLDLTPYTGNNILLAFETINQKGNQLFLDNIQIDGVKRVDCVLPTTVNINPLSASSVQIDWVNEEESANYVVRIREQGTTEWLNAYMSTNNGVLIEDLEGKAYELEIQTICSETNKSDFSQQYYFSLEDFVCPAPFDVQANNIGEKSASISWETVSNADYYIVTYQSDDGTAIETTATENYLGLEHLIEGGIYFVKVKAVCEGIGESSFSTALTVVLNGSCKVPEQLSVSDITEYSAIIQWQAVHKSNEYKLQYQEVGMGESWFIINTKEPTYHLSALKEGSLYKVKVQSNCEYESSKTSQELVFETQTACRDIHNINIETLGFESALINWDGGATDGYNLSYQKEGSTVWNNIFTEVNSFDFYLLESCSNYLLKIQSICGDYKTEFTEPFELRTPCEENYCTLRSESSALDWIESVRFGKFVNQTGNDGGYQDYKEKVITIAKDSPMEFELRPGSNRKKGRSEQWQIWVDWNQNGAFEATEAILQTKSFNSILGIGASMTSGTTGTLTIPSNAIEGVTLMRVALQNEVTAPACGTFSEGEVEDYSVNIIARPGKTAAAPSVAARLVVAPNPTTSYINLYYSLPSSSAYQLQVFDLQGKLWIDRAMKPVNRSADGSMRLAVDQWNKGVYLLMITNGTEQIIEKLIVE